MADSFILTNVDVVGTTLYDKCNSVEVVDGKVVRVFKVDYKNPLPQAQHLIDGRGSYLSPGWVDIGVYALPHCTPQGVDVDRWCLSRGVTTVVDSGSTGAATYPALQNFIAERCKTRVFSFLNICKNGVFASEVGSTLDLQNQVDPEQCLARIREFPDQIVGVKACLTSSHGMDVTTQQEVYRRALQCAEDAHLPLLVEHIKSSVPVQADTGLSCPGSLRKGDIYSPTCHAGEGSIANETSVHPAVEEAKERGVLFDVGHGTSGFNWNVAEVTKGLTTIVSSGLDSNNVSGPVYDLPSVMSKVINLKHYEDDVKKVIPMVTYHAATAINRQHLVGDLMLGMDADMTLFKLHDDSDLGYDLEDSHGQLKKIGNHFVPLRVWRKGVEYPIIAQANYPNKAKRAHLAKDLDKLVLKD